MVSNFLKELNLEKYSTSDTSESDSSPDDDCSTKIKKKEDNKNQRTDSKEPAIHGHLFVKVFTILFMCLLLIQCSFNSIYILSTTPYNQWTEYYPFFLTLIIRIPTIPFIILVLCREKTIGNTCALIMTLIYSVFEVIGLFVCIYLIDFNKFIPSFITQVLVVHSVIVLTLTSYIRRKTAINKTIRRINKLNGVKPKKDRIDWLTLIKINFSAIEILIAIILTISTALFLRWKSNMDPENRIVWTKRHLMYLGFIGEIFLRILSSLVIPLLITCITHALASIKILELFQIAIRTCVYYLVTTIIAVLLGILLVSVLKPGFISGKNTTPNNSTVRTEEPQFIVDLILDIFRNVFSNNIFQSTFRTHRTKLTNPYNLSLDQIELWQITGGHTETSNIMGLVVVSVAFGLIVSLKSDEWKLMVDIIRILNKTVLIVTGFVVNFTPIGIIFMVMPQIVGIEDIPLLFQRIGLFTITVLLGLSIHLLIILPLIYYIMTRKNPYEFMANMFPAMILAFGTSSSVATMTKTMKALEDDNHIDHKVVQFCIPIGASVNMDGTAFYEAVASIFIAQLMGRNMTFVELLLISITATLASIGAAGVPQAGLITIVIVLNALGLSLEEAGIVMIVDWFLDRFRTVVNVMGDAFGAGIVDYMIKE